MNIIKRYEENFPDNRMRCGFGIDFNSDTYLAGGFILDMSVCFADIEFARMEMYSPKENSETGDIETVEITWLGSDVTLRVFVNEVEFVGDYTGNWHFHVVGMKS
jgi:hypothetical protein